MADLVMVATMVAFVLLCVAYVGWCDRIIVRDENGLDAHGQPSDAVASGDASDAVAREQVTA